MSAKYRNMVALTWNGPNGPFMKKATTDREVGRMCRKHGMPSHVDALRVKVGEVKAEADKLPLSGQIPTSSAQGLISVKSNIEHSSGTTAQPMTYRVIGTHDGTNVSIDATYIEPGLLRREWAEYLAGHKPGEMVGTATYPTQQDILAATRPMSRKTREGVEKAIKPALGAYAYIMDENGAITFVPPVGPGTWAYRVGTPATHRDGTPMPNPDTYLIYGEKAGKALLTREDMNRVSPAEARKVQQMSMNMCRSRDAQRITKKSDISSKSDGADMYDAMQDSVLYYAQALKWAQTLPVAAISVESREATHWSLIPRKAHEMAADADILGEEFDVGAYTVNISKTSLMWQAVRNAARDNFSIPDAAMRAFKAKFLKTVIDDETGEFGTTLEEYTQNTNNGTPGYSLTYPDRYVANYDGTHQASAEPARSGWTLRLRNGKGGSSRKPQHVAVGALRTAADNPYQDILFATAWDNGDNYPILREAFQLGINAADVHKEPIWRKIAEKVHNGKKVTWKDIRDIKEQGRREWAELRESLGTYEPLVVGTETHKPTEKGVDVDDL